MKFLNIISIGFYFLFLYLYITAAACNFVFNHSFFKICTSLMTGFIFLKQSTYPDYQGTHSTRKIRGSCFSEIDEWSISQDQEGSWPSNERGEWSHKPFWGIELLNIVKELLCWLKGLIWWDFVGNLCMGWWSPTLVRNELSEDDVSNSYNHCVKVVASSLLWFVSLMEILFYGFPLCPLTSDSMWPIECLGLSVFNSTNHFITPVVLYKTIAFLSCY